MNEPTNPETSALNQALDWASQDSAGSDIEITETERGFHLYGDPVTTTYGHEVHVYESSARNLMPSPSVTFRLTAELGDALGDRAAGPVTGAVAQAQLSRYFAFLAAQLATVRMSREQALCLIDIMHGTLIDPSWMRDPGRLLAYEITDAAPDGYAEKWDVDLNELATLCGSWNAGQALAVIDAIERFWAAEVADYDQALQDIGLLRPRREGL